MGGQHSDISAVTLNYSGIYLSPFEYYGMDNWQQLEKIGRIFEEELKKEYLNIKEFTEKDPEKKGYYKQKTYNRKGFEWLVGDIDKDIHIKRYTPIYTSEENIANDHYAGIIVVDNKQCFMNQNQFYDEWDRVFRSVDHQTAKVQIKISQKATDMHKYHCRMFDFLCYRSIALYVNHVENFTDTIFNFRQQNHWKFEKLAEDTKTYDMSKVIERYKKLMAHYFEGINVQKKRKLTIEWLFKKNKPETLSFVEATAQFREQLINNVEDYYLFGPTNEKKKKQTLIMLKNTLPFIPANYDPRTTEQQNLKAQLAQKLQKHTKAFIEFWERRLKKTLKEKQLQKAEKWLKDLNTKGFLFWTDDITLVRFKQTKVIVGGFHLSSKTEIGQIQGQLMGLMIYHLVVEEDYKFIFSGDFNSYITLSDKDEVLCVFEFVRYLFPENSNLLFRTVHIYPKHPKIYTTKKKRTILQVQTRKVNDLAEKCIDQVITNYYLDFNKSHVGQIADIKKFRNNFSSFLPHKEHPYDHFCVEATIDLKRPN